MEEDQPINKRISVRMSDEEMERAERLRKRLEQHIHATKYGGGMRVTQKTLVIEALEALEKQLDKESK